MLSQTEILDASETSGFDAVLLEKAAHLLNLLNTLTPIRF